LLKLCISSGTNKEETLPSSSTFKVSNAIQRSYSQTEVG
jgi:hypothetical protein